MSVLKGIVPIETTGKRKREDETTTSSSSTTTEGIQSTIVVKKTMVASGSSRLSQLVAASAAQNSSIFDKKNTSSSSVELISTLSPDGTSHKIEIAPEKVGSIIGSKGAVIIDMQSRTNCKMYVKQDFPAGVNRLLTITGTALEVKMGTELIKLIIEHGPNAITTNGTATATTMTSIVECPHEKVGRVIGSKGDTIKELQTRTGSRIQIQQDKDLAEGEPRKVKVEGSHVAVTLAVQLIHYIIENGPTFPALSAQMAGPFPQGMNPQGMTPSMLQNVGVVLGHGAASGHGAAPGHGLPMSHSHYGGGDVNQQMPCAKAFVGKLIGKKGETMTTIQERTGAKVVIDQNVPEGQPCKLSISGPHHSVVAVTQIVQMVMNGFNPRDAMDKACATMGQGSGHISGPPPGHGGHMGVSGGIHGHAPPMAPHMGAPPGPHHHHMPPPGPHHGGTMGGVHGGMGPPHYDPHAHSMAPHGGMPGMPNAPSNMGGSHMGSHSGMMGAPGTNPYMMNAPLPTAPGQGPGPVAQHGYATTSMSGSMSAMGGMGHGPPPMGPGMPHMPPPQYGGGGGSQSPHKMQPTYPHQHTTVSTHPHPGAPGQGRATQPSSLSQGLAAKQHHQGQHTTTSYSSIPPTQYGVPSMGSGGMMSQAMQGIPPVMYNTAAPTAAYMMPGTATHAYSHTMQPKPTTLSCWSEHKNDQGISYYYNSATMESTYERPAGF